MAVSRDSSNGPDWKDLHQALCNIELFNQCQISLCIHNRGSDGAKYLILEARARELPERSGEVWRSASVVASMKQLNARTLSAAFLNLLNRLDHEWGLLDAVNKS